MKTYRCTNCGRVGRAFAFKWLSGGMVTGAPSVRCPACITLTGTVVDQDGNLADPMNPPEDASWTVDQAQLDFEKSVTRALRANMASNGRPLHGESLGSDTRP